VLPPGQSIDLGIASGKIHLVDTSGTTDDKITNIWNQEWWDASERASWKLNSHMTRLATGDHHEAILVNPKNVGIISDNVDLPIERRRLSRYLYLNEKTDPLSWTPAIMDRMVSELDAFRPRCSKPIHRSCKAVPYLAARGSDVYQPGAIVFTYEYPTVLHHRQIGRIFSAPRISSYGTTEVGYVFMQCEEGSCTRTRTIAGLIFSPFCRARRTSPRQDPGHATAEPLELHGALQYGDLVSLDESGKCRCGRNTGLIWHR